MANFNETKDYTFNNLCKVFERFKIPNFQRPYSWTNKNIQEFWSSIISNESPYFIGNIVAVKDLNDHDKSLSIVDGQQRLTTTNLLLIAIRDYLGQMKLKKGDKDKVDRIKRPIDKCLKDDGWSLSVESGYKRLLLGKDVYQKIFEKLVDGVPFSKEDISNLSDTQKRILNNYEIIKQLIQEEVGVDNIEKIEEILSKVLNLQFIVIVCESENDIYGIFEGFNSTGLGLSVADMVKNAVLKASLSDQLIQNQIEETWNELEACFEEIDNASARFPKFLRHQWISYYGDVRMSVLYRKIKDEKIENKKPIQIKEFVETVLKEGKIYLGMIYQKHEANLICSNELRHAFADFRFLQNDQVYEVLLSYYRAYSESKISESFLKKFLTKLWIFTVRSSFVSVSPSDYEKIFAGQCKEIASSLDSAEISSRSDIFFSKLKKLVSSREQFIENFISDAQFNRSKKLITRSFKDLMELDNPEISTSSPELEHILPQEPKEWGLSKSDIKDHVHKIGNLTLLFSDFNKKNSNKKMEFKSNVFNNSAFNINKEIANVWADKFTSDFKKAIDERSIEIAGRIEKMWRL